MILHILVRGGREALKSQIGLFGPLGQAARAAGAPGWGGAGTHVEMRQDRSGRTEARHIRDQQAEAPVRPAGPAQADIFGQWHQPKADALPPAPKAVPSQRRAVCARCHGQMPKGQSGRVCDACERTVDLRAHPSFSHLFG